MLDMITIDRLRAIVLEFPGVEESTEEIPAFRVRKRLLVWMREDGKSIAIKASEDDLETYPYIKPETFSVPNHYVGYGILVIDLATITETELRDFVARAWMRMAPKSLVEAWNTGGNMKNAGATGNSIKRKQTSPRKTRRTS
jgi:hypothetical protein